MRAFLFLGLCLFINSTFSKPLVIEVPLVNGTSLLSNFHISDVRDDREKKDSIGYFLNTWGNKQNIKLGDTCELSLLRFLSKLVPFGEKTEGIKLVIKTFGISETEDVLLLNSRLGTGHLTCEFYSTDNKLLYMTDCIENFQRSNDAKDFFPEYVAYLLKKSITTFMHYDRTSNRYFNLLGQYNLCDSILKVDTYRKGFYTNFKEFQANNPSLIYKFENSQDTNFENVKRNAKKMLELLPLVWGFSDGQSCFKKQRLPSGQYTFVPIKNLGRYTYVGSRYERQSVPIILPFMFGVISLPYEQDYIMDLNSGKEYPLEDKTLRIILGLDPQALDAYLKQPIERREEMGVYWVKQYNKRYKERIQSGY